MKLDAAGTVGHGGHDKVVAVGVVEHAEHKIWRTFLLFFHNP
jgi:cyclopropane fatty-acyl-phospholipid synthase-like methyltransferase